MPSHSHIKIDLQLQFPRLALFLLDEVVPLDYLPIQSVTVLGLRNKQMGRGLQDRLERLNRQPKEALFALWKELFGVSPPRGARRDLLVRFLAYKIQEQAYGGLRQETRRRLSELARKLAANSTADLTGSQQIKLGIRLVREWKGQSHCVTVLEMGYEYKGKQFSSLSQIARLITGTRWSGPLFFGLRAKPSKGQPNGE